MDDDSVDATEHSVLARLSVDGSFEPPLLLDDESGEDGAPLVTPTSRSEGRYQVMGEIARGGVGVVLRGHDVDLGRPVAMKVVRKEYAHDREVLQRFVEEAQIGGQLQHPGVVPVYEMGLGEDGRPYFTMKLVKGRTLAALLKEPSLPGGRRSLLKAFESVCQTMAYAHARGVIHRDIKPANIMVGAFGEVLVVDWGMGKVLRGSGESQEAPGEATDRSLIATLRSETDGSQSIVGSVMGTPRYMPPEQARGDVAAVDQRSDVFSLGAVLCEILTGQAPYAGDGREAHTLACRGELGDAMARLDACGEDEVLVTLVKDCLTLAPMGRPVHAGEVADRVGAHLAGVDERARAARLEAAEARVHAEGDRRRRRLSLALAGSVAVLLVASVLGLTAWRTAAADRQAEVSVMVSDALAEAARLRGTARSAGTLEAFDKARTAALRARTVASSDDASGGERERVERLLEALEVDRAAAVERLQIQERDAAMVARLEAIRVRIAGDAHAQRGAFEDYKEAFRDYGIDLERASDEAVVAALDASDIGATLWAHLHICASVEMQLVTFQGQALTAGGQRAALEERGEPPLTIRLRRIERDPWRRRLLSERTLDGLRSLAADPRVEAQAPTYVMRLAEALVRYGDVHAARRLAREVLARNPKEVTMHVLLGGLYLGAPRNLPEAIRHFTVAISLAPDSVQPRLSLAAALIALSRPHEGLAHAQAARRIAPPDHVQARAAEALYLFNAGQSEAAERAARALVSDLPQEAVAHFTMGRILQQLGRAEPSAAAFERGLELNPYSDWAWALLGGQRALLGEEAAAEEAYDKAIEINPLSGLAWGSKAEQALRVRADLDAALTYARKAAALAPENAGSHVVLAQAYFMLENHAGARAAATRALRMLDPGGRLAEEAMALSAGYCHYVVGVLLARQIEPRSLQQACKHLRRSRELSVDPTFLNAVNATLAAVLFNLDKPEEARAVVDDALPWPTDDGVVLSVRGYVLFRLREYEAAAATLEHAYRIGKCPPERLGELSHCMMDVGRLRAALKYGNEMLARLPGVVLPYISVSDVLARIERHEEAAACLAKGAAFVKYPFPFTVRRGIEMIKLGRMKEARVLHARAAEIRRTRAEPLDAGEAQGFAELGGLIEWEARFEAFRRGEVEPRGAYDRQSFAYSLFKAGELTKAVTLVEALLRDEPAFMNNPRKYWRFHAARMFLAAGRYDEAHAIFRSEIEHLTPRLRDEDKSWRVGARQRLEFFLLMDDLAVVRDPALRAKLPTAEQGRWAKLFADVEAILDDPAFPRK